MERLRSREILFPLPLPPASETDSRPFLSSLFFILFTRTDSTDAGSDDTVDDTTEEQTTEDGDEEEM